MRLVVESDRRLRVLPVGAGLEIRSASADAAVDFSPLHMLAASLATCTISVLADWAASAELDIADLEITIDWEYVEDPYRVGRYEMMIHWPDLSESRRAAALRVARHCTVENTLEHPPAIAVGVEG